MGNVVFDSFNDTVLNVYYLVGLVGNSAFVCDDYDGHPRPVQVFQYLHHFYGGLTVQCSCGSSARIICGRVMSARAMATRCFCPPLISFGI